MGRSIGLNKYISNEEQFILPKWSLESWLLSFLLFVFYVEIKFDIQGIDVKLLYLSIDLMVHYDIDYNVIITFMPKKVIRACILWVLPWGYNVNKLGIKRYANYSQG